MAKWVKAGVILVVLILLFIPTIVAMKYVAIAQIYSYFVDSVSSLTGLNTYLVKAVMALMLVPLLIGMKFFFSTNRTRRTTGTLTLVTLVILYNLSLYHFTKDLYFTFSEGKATKWYALTPEGVTFFDKSGIDPVYGIQLKPVTPEVIRNLKRLQKGDFKPIDPANAQFFNPITGEAQVWYYQYPDGGYEFYDKPGYHPVTGETLKPATKQVYFEWKEKEKVKEKQQEEVRHQQAEEERKRQEELQQRLAEEKEKRIAEEEERRRNVASAQVKVPVPAPVPSGLQGWSDRIFPPPPTPERSIIKISKSAIAKSVDQYNRPEGISTIFTEGSIPIYCIEYEDAIPRTTRFKAVWYRDGNIIKQSEEVTTTWTNGRFTNQVNTRLSLGNYEARLLIDGQEVDRAFFIVQ